MATLRTDAADESERAQNLLLGQQNLHNLVVGRGQTLRGAAKGSVSVDSRDQDKDAARDYLQHVQGQLMGGGVRALQGQEQTGLKEADKCSRKRTKDHLRKTLEACPGAGPPGRRRDSRAAWSR